MQKHRLSMVRQKDAIKRNDERAEARNRKRIEDRVVALESCRILGIDPKEALL
jgi:hypothetical protein